MNKKYAELDFPAWFDGKDVNEAAFCREFLSKNKLIYADNAFFTPDGRLTGPLLLKEKIYAEPECCAAKNIPRTISNIVEIMKLAAHAESFPPKPDEIHVQNGTLRIDGSFLAGRPEIVRSRFPVAYNPQAEKPVVWLRFLSDLLYPEDIPTFQEYIGYCLVSSTKGQRMICLLYTSSSNAPSSGGQTPYRGHSPICKLPRSPAVRRRVPRRQKMCIRDRLISSPARKRRSLCRRMRCKRKSKSRTGTAAFLRPPTARRIMKQLQ